MAETYLNRCHRPAEQIHHKNSQCAGAREWLDLKALTQYASISKRTIRQWIHNSTNPLPAVRVGSILIRRSEFDRWLENHRVEPVDVGFIVGEMVSELVGSH